MRTYHARETKVSFYVSVQTFFSLSLPPLFFKAKAAACSDKFFHFL